MSDISPIFSEILKQHGAGMRERPVLVSEISDEFLKEAYKINTHTRSLHQYLLSIRQPYLSTSLPPHRARRFGANQTQQSRTYFTDTQRDQIDAESKATLRDLNAGIRQLDEVENIRKDTERQLAAKKRQRNGFGGLGRWAAGGLMGDRVALSPEEKAEELRREVFNSHRDSVIWYLRWKLEEAAEVQREMMETRIEREVEKSKSILYKNKGLPPLVDDMAAESHDGGAKSGAKSKGRSDGAAAFDEREREEIEKNLSPEQLQLFAQENNDMLKHYEDTLDQVKTAERSMLEISELQTTLAQNLEMQSTRIDQLVEDSQTTEENVVGGNKQLKKAAERWRPAKFVFYFSCGLSAFLIAWDLVI